jgi:hypothetical protein
MKKPITTKRSKLLQLIWDITNTTVTDATLAKRYNMTLVVIRRYRLAVDRFNGKEPKEVNNQPKWMRNNKRSPK